MVIITAEAGTMVGYRILFHKKVQEFKSNLEIY